MNCPICGWGINLLQQWESHGYACAIFKCDDCECEVVAKTPVSKMGRKWDSEKFSKKIKKDKVVESLSEILKD